MPLGCHTAKNRYFNPLPRKEGDTSNLTALQSSIISIHSLVKRETNAFVLQLVTIAYFNPLPRKEGDLFRTIWNLAKVKYFNPLPRKEGDIGRVSLTYVIDISIHSLVKRETADSMIG